MTIVLDIEVPDKEFYYLAGPMTGLPFYNFPRFEEVATKLRERGYAICSPAELDSPDEAGYVMQRITGKPRSPERQPGSGQHWRALLRRDLNIVMHPLCRGIIVIEGWEDSTGANLETYVGDRFNRELLRYTEDSLGRVRLIPIDRDEQLNYHVERIQQKIGEFC